MEESVGWQEWRELCARDPDANLSCSFNRVYEYVPGTRFCATAPGNHAYTQCNAVTCFKSLLRVHQGGSGRGERFGYGEVGSFEGLGRGQCQAIGACRIEFARSAHRYQLLSHLHDA